MKPIRDTLESLNLSKSMIYKEVTVFPLIGDAPPAASYLTLDAATARGAVHVREVSRGGRVPELLFVNRGDLPVLAIDGEELVGAKQNRVLNLTILVAPHTKTVVPVSCVEAGRWSYAGDEFTPSACAQFAVGRAARMRTVSAALSASGSRHSDQHAVWDDIAAKADRLNAPSPTGAMAEIFARHRPSLEAYVRGLPVARNQTGAVFAIGPRVVGAELFDHPDTLSALWPKLVRSYALDAIERAHHTDERSHEDGAKSFLNHLADAEMRAYPAVGLGTDVRLSGPDVVGGALVLDESVIHLAAFATDAAAGNGRREQRPGLASPWRRACRYFVE
ncbi:MAG: hypothetical protein JSV80_06250 [Acidobacteriota bacterium]|nr:MAG: hypothetical protein JSV80_06250 [Acidobacteriota bacterium]